MSVGFIRHVSSSSGDRRMTCHPQSANILNDESSYGVASFQTGIDEWSEWIIRSIC